MTHKLSGGVHHVFLIDQTVITVYTFTRQTLSCISRLCLASHQVKNMDHSMLNKSDIVLKFYLTLFFCNTPIFVYMHMLVSPH